MVTQAKQNVQEKVNIYKQNHPPQTNTVVSEECANCTGEECEKCQNNNNNNDSVNYYNNQDIGDPFAYNSLGSVFDNGF